MYIDIKRPVFSKITPVIQWYIVKPKASLSSSSGDRSLAILWTVCGRFVGVITVSSKK